MGFVGFVGANKFGAYEVVMEPMKQDIKNRFGAYKFDHISPI